jgi:2,3-bisphosphoglycerate-dependent phosphoglycerate mutase
MKKKQLTLYVLTHTETYYNRKRVFTGQTDSALTPLGRRQAQRQAERLKHKKIGLAFISPLRRTRQTLSYIAKYHPSMEICMDKRLSERDYGRLEHKSKVKYRRENPKLYQMYHRSYDIPPPGGESLVQVERRVLPFLRDVIKLMKKKQKNAVIVGHNNSLRPIRRYFEKLSPQKMMKLDNYHKIFRYKI